MEPNRKMNTLPEFVSHLHSLELYYNFTEWLESLPMGTTPQQAWNMCENGDWMLQLCADATKGAPENSSNKKLVLAACGCARLPLQLIPASKDHIEKAIITAERWASGDHTITLEDMNAASYAVTTVDTACHSANSAAHYAITAHTADTFSHYAAVHAAAAFATFSNNKEEARRATLAKCADIVRSFYPEIPL